MKLNAAAVITLLAASTASAEPKLDMLAFFTGKTHAENVMKVALKKPARLIVDSVGSRRGDQFILAETVREEGKPVRERKWVMRPAGPNRFTGSLTDATTPVDIRLDGQRATIRYTMKGGLNVTQQLEMRDARTLSNRVNVRKFGLKFASVEGTIRKLD
jgi:hypothetical protein